MFAVVCLFDNTWWGLILPESDNRSRFSGDLEREMSSPILLFRCVLYG